jgi:uncharacterized membrane protein
MNLRFMRGLIIIPYLADTFYLLRKNTHVRKHITSASNFTKAKLSVKGLYKSKKGYKMKHKLIINLTLLTLIITACGGQTTQSTPEPAAPTQAVTQPTPVPATTTTTSATEAPMTEATEPVTESPAAGVSFAKDVMPIFENSCSECHGGKQIKEGLDMSTYEGLMAGSFNGTVLVAGNSAESLLVDLVSKGKMPKRGAKLTAEQIQIISEWIDAGALNN